ncbi:STK11IP family protein [Megaselia abdita]
MNSVSVLAQLLRENGDKILSSDFKLKLSVSLLRTLNIMFQRYPTTCTEILDRGFNVLKGNNTNTDIQLIHDFVQKTFVVCLTCYPTDKIDTNIDISKFKNVKCLEIRKIPLTKIKGIQPIRTQMEQIKCTQCLSSVEEIITACGADNSAGFPWNNLVSMDLSFNKLVKIDNSLEFVQNLRYLNISHNKLTDVDSLNVLPNLVVLDLSYNRLTKTPYFHMDAIGKIEILNLNHNLIESLNGMSKLDALFELNLANNCFVNYEDMGPLNCLKCLRYLQLSGNPLSFHSKHRILISSILHNNAVNVKFMLNGMELTKKEKDYSGKTFLRSCHHLNVPSSSSAANVINQGHIISSLKMSTNDKQRKKRSSRLIEIDKVIKIWNPSDDISTSVKFNENEHLVKKKYIESLRQEYGSDWLTRSCGETVEEDMNNEEQNRFETGEELIEVFNEEIAKHNDTMSSSSIDNRIINNLSVTSSCFSLILSDSKLSTEEPITLTENIRQEVPLNQRYKDSKTKDNIIRQELEDNDLTDSNFVYNVTSQTNLKDMMLQVSDVFMKEKSLSGSDISKWNLIILESCDRLRSNTLRINFDTVRKDKQERIYVFKDESQSRELEFFLRNILSKRSLSEMNQQVYKCLNCNCQFSMETKKGRFQQDLTCPDCKSLFLCEQKDITSNNVIIKEIPHESDVEVISNSYSSRSSSVEVLPEEKTKKPKIDEVVMDCNELQQTSIFDTIIQSTNKLMSRTIPRDSLNMSFSKYTFNYIDFSDVDHRLKLFLYQTMFQDSNEEMKWIVKTKYYIEATDKFVESGVLVMSSSKLYLFEIFSLDYAENVANWMRKLQSVPVENIEQFGKLPYNIGLWADLKSVGNLLLILQDSLRCKSLIEFLMTKQKLPYGCRLYRDECLEKLKSGTDKSDIEMLTIINNVGIVNDKIATNFDTTVLYLTNDNLFLMDPTTDFHWLIPNYKYNLTSNIASQSLTNLVEINNVSDNRFSLCFLEETLNKLEVWDCMFETKGSMEYCLLKIDNSWSALFGVSLLNN